MRIKNILSAFADFKWEDLAMSQQLFEDYKSKYLDLYDKVKSDHKKEKVSILEDVDFELELIHRDEINVAYIIQLLIKLKAKSLTKDSLDSSAAEKEILSILSGEADLRSKRELIEKFIQENLPAIKDSEEVTESFEKFWNEQKQSAFEQIIKDENLSVGKTQTLIEDYLYAEREPLRDEVLQLLECEQPKILERKKTGDRILKKIMGFVETFINGMSTT